MKTLKIYEKNPASYFWLYLALAFLFRLPSLFIPYLDIDEVLWGLTANAIVDGHVPYQEVMGEKPPLLYLSYAAIFWLFGKHNYFAVHVFGIVWMALTALFIANFVKRAAGGKVAFFAGALYLIFGNAAGFRMLATTGELMMNLFLAASALIFLSGFEKKDHGKIFAAGALVAVAGMFRQQSLIQGGAYAAFLAIVLFRRGIDTSKVWQLAKMGTSLALGCLVVVAACFFYVELSGAKNDFYFWVVKHNYSYIKSGFLNGHVLRNFALRTGLVLATTLPLWILAAKRAKSFWTNQDSTNDAKRRFEILAWLYFAVSLIAVTPGGRFFPHYFLQAFPPLCILAALELCEASPRSARLFWILISLYAFVLLCKMPFIPWEMSVNDKGDYGAANRVVGEYVKDRTTAKDRIFIWGWAQGIYYYSGRDPAARFISSDFLTGRSPSQNDELDPDTSSNITPGSWDMLFADFKKHAPTYILDTSPGNYHGYAIYPLDEFPQLYDYIKKNYSFEKRVEGVDLYHIQNIQKKD